MTSNPTPKQIAKMDSDQLRALLLGHIQLNAQLQQTVHCSSAAIKAKDFALKAKDELIKEQMITIKYQETVLSK